MAEAQKSIEATEAQPENDNDRSRTNPLEDLLSLVHDLAPFLADSGKVYCHIRGSDKTASTLYELRHQVTRDVLLYRYRERTRDLPQRGLVDQEISIVHGQLWNERKKSTRAVHCVTRLIAKAAEDQESWLGSATDLLTLIEQTNQTYNILKENEQLPSNENALGILLGKLVLELRGEGLWLYRPSRKDTKRLWAWKRLTFPDDASDTFTEEHKQLMATYESGGAI